jgi:hypothetical protein
MVKWQQTFIFSSSLIFAVNNQPMETDDKDDDNDDDDNNDDQLTHSLSFSLSLYVIHSMMVIVTFYINYIFVHQSSLKADLDQATNSLFRI